MQKVLFSFPFSIFVSSFFFLWSLTPSLFLSISELNCRDHCENVVFSKIKKKIQFDDEFYMIVSNSYSTINFIEWMSYSYKIRRTHKAIYFQNTYELLKWNKSLNRCKNAVLNIFYSLDDHLQGLWRGCSIQCWKVTLEGLLLLRRQLREQLTQVSIDHILQRSQNKSRTYRIESG